MLKKPNLYLNCVRKPIGVNSTQRLPFIHMAKTFLSHKHVTICCSTICFSLFFFPTHQSQCSAFTNALLLKTLLSSHYQILTMSHLCQRTCPFYSDNCNYSCNRHFHPTITCIENSNTRNVFGNICLTYVLHFYNNHLALVSINNQMLKLSQQKTTTSSSFLNTFNMKTFISVFY